MALLTPVYVVSDILRILTTLLYNATFGIVLRSHRLSYKQNLLFRTLKTVRKCTVIGKKIDLDGTHTAYKNFVKKHSLPYRVTPLGVHTAQLLWLGSPDAKHVVLCFHGGAYTHPAVSGHFTIMQRLVEAAAGSGTSLQAAVLKHDLAPSQQYPAQLEEACAGLKYILQDLNYNSEQISIVGDSAGGNLALALVSHLAHPHPLVKPCTLPQGSQLANIVLLSPWVTFNNDSATWRENIDTDYMLDFFLAQSASLFMGKGEIDYYNQPIDAPASWWENVPAKQIGITYGKLEVFADDIVKLGEHMKTARPECTQVLGCEHEAHDQAGVNSTIGWAPAESEKALTRWILGKSSNETTSQTNAA